ncbi:hypothetical protein ENUP19_0054G0095 [Entamoeba nuttalli]
MQDLVFEFPAVNTYLDSFSSLTAGCISFFTEKASIETEYGSRLLNLTKVPLKRVFQRYNPKDNMSSTMKEFIDKFISQNKIMAECHLNAAQFIEKNIVQATKTSAQQLETKMSVITNEINRRIKQHNDMVSTVERIKENKEKALNQLKKLKEEKKGKSGKTYQKMNCKQDQIVEDIKKYNTNLKNCVIITNKIRENVYGKEMKCMLNQIEGIASEWNELLINMFTLGNDLDIEILKNTSKYCLKIQQSIQKINWTNDIEEFVNKWKNVHSVNDIILTSNDLALDDHILCDESTLEMIHNNGSSGTQTKECPSNYLQVTLSE